MKMLAFIFVFLFMVTACQTGNVVKLNFGDSCIDSDGLDEYKYGRVTFKENGRVFEYKDECITTRRVREGVCRDGTLDYEDIHCDGNSKCRFGYCKRTRF